MGSRHWHDAADLYTTLSIASIRAIIIITITNILNYTYGINELCPGRCKCEDEFLRATCVFASLEVVPIQLNPEIQHLDLSNNRIDNLNLAFGFYDNLQSLDLSSNIIHTLGSENFLLQKRLISLNVSNNGIKNISKSALKGLESLNILDLSNNNISNMDPQAFRYTNELINIDLSGNSLMSLPDNLLKNLHRIKILKLSRNSLLQMPKSNLELAPSLQLLDLSDNLILEIGHSSIPSLRSLITLNLANNIIQSVSDDAFERLPALVYLNIKGNNLTNVPTNALSRLSILSELILSSNPLITLNSLAFRNLFELKTLDLRQCEIIEINQRAFADNINLERILLDGNHQLQYLPSRVLYNARYLKAVSLRHCKLSTLQPTHFPIDTLKILHIGGNPFSCNCSLHWLWNVINTVQHKNITKLSVDSDEIICNDVEFTEKLLMNLTENSLKCRLSPLYLVLLAGGCLTATATILTIIAWITRVKRRKRLSFSPPSHTRPDMLVYVESTQNESTKNLSVQQHSGDRRLIESDHETLYDITPHENRNKNITGIKNNFKLNSNLYERPDENYYQNAGSSMSSSTNRTTIFHDDKIKGNICHRNIEGLYAVTDIKVPNNYQMNNHSKSNHHSQMLFLSGNKNSDYDLDYNDEYSDPTVAPNKTPHVVFV